MPPPLILGPALSPAVGGGGSVAAAATTAAAVAATAAGATAAAVAAATAGAATAATAVAAATGAATAAATAIAATTTAVAATTGAAAATTEAARTLFTRTRFVDDEGAAVEGLAVHAVDGRLGFGVRAHLHEAEALGAAGIAVHHDLGGCDGAELGESLLKIVVADAVGKVAYVEFVAHWRAPFVS